MTKHLILTICIISGYLWTNTALAQDSDQDLMPEFCVATFLATGNQAEADIWLKRYDLQREFITYMQFNLEILLKENEIRAEDIIAASDGCKAASHEEREDD